MKRAEFKIQTPHWTILVFFCLFLIIYLASLYIIWHDWSEIKKGPFTYGLGLMTLIGLYFINYIIYTTTNRIEINYENLELKEKVLNFTLYTININAIQKIYSEFPLINCGPGRHPSVWLLMPNYRESAEIELQVNNKFIRKNWYLGKNNTNRIINVLTNINSAITISDKSFNPSFFAKRTVDAKSFRLVMLISIPLIIALLCGLRLLQNK